MSPGLGGGPSSLKPPPCNVPSADRHRPPIMVSGKWGQEEVRGSGPQELLKCVFIGSMAQERPQWSTQLTYKAALEVGGSCPREEMQPALASLWGLRGQWI